MIGDDAGLEILAAQMQSEADPAPPTDNADHSLRLRRLPVSRRSQLVGVTVADSGIRDVYDCMIIGFEDRSGSLEGSEASRTIVAGDVLWVVGERPALQRLQDLTRPPQSLAPTPTRPDASV